MNIGMRWEGKRKGEKEGREEGRLGGEEEIDGKEGRGEGEGGLEGKRRVGNDGRLERKRERKEKSIV